MIALDRAWSASSNDVQNRRNGLMEPELRGKDAKIQVLRRTSTVFSKGYSAFGVDVLEVTYEILLSTDLQWSKSWGRMGK